MIFADGDWEATEKDVCIVGAGPVGLALALKLEALGLTVMVLERGDGDGPSSHQQPGTIEFQNSHHAISQAMSRPGIGGTSALWGGRCVPLDDLDFQPREHVPCSGWPISHDQVRRHYPEALSFLTCNNADAPIVELAGKDKVVVTDALERWSKHPALGPYYADRLLASTTIGVLTSASVAEIVLEADGERVKSLRVEHRGTAVEVAAKIYVLAGGGLENARLLLSLQQSHPEAGKAFGTSLGRFYQGHLTGYIAILRFFDPKTALAVAFRTDARGYSYRQRLQIAPETQAQRKLLNTVFWIDALSIADPAHGSGALSLCYLALAASGLYGRVSKGLAPTARGRRNIDKAQHWRNIREDAGWPADLLQAMKNLFRRRMGGHRTLFNPKGRYLLRYHAEQVPNPESRVSLTPHAQPGQSPALSVDYRVVDQDIVSVMESHELLDEWLRRNQIGQLEYLHEPTQRRQAVVDQAFDGYHQIGLTRMADSPADGPVDSDCKLHGVSNLYLGGSGVFPTGGHANPTLPAVALALRLAEHVRDKLKPAEAA